MTHRAAIVLAFPVAATVPRALAHHSFAAEFDASKAIRVTGTLAKVEWTNPHTYFYVDVKDDTGAVIPGSGAAPAAGFEGRARQEVGRTARNNTSMRGRHPNFKRPQHSPGGGKTNGSR